MSEQRRQIGRMNQALTLRDTRTPWSVAAALLVSVGVVVSAGIAEGRVDPSTGQPTASLISPGTNAIVTGGGTVVATPGSATTVSSFGLNAKRPVGYTGGEAQGRINYDRHSSAPGRHVNVPVTRMEAETNNLPPNSTGGKAILAGNCGGAGNECPTNIQSVLVYVEDNSDSGGGFDVFRIFICNVPAFLPDPLTFDPTSPPDNCTGPEGGLTIRTGNIQVRPGGGSGSGQAPTAARAPLRLP